MRRKESYKLASVAKMVPVVFVLLLLGGCIGNSYWVWEHPGKLTQDQLFKDQQECRKLANDEAGKATYYYHYYYDYPFDRPPYYHDRFYRYDYGWDSHYRFLQYQNNRDRFFRICMKAKGWQRVRKQLDTSKQPDSATGNNN